MNFVTVCAQLNDTPREVYTSATSSNYVAEVMLPPVGKNKSATSLAFMFTARLLRNSGPLIVVLVCMYTVQRSVTTLMPRHTHCTAVLLQLLMIRFRSLTM
jgi:hypothetical protein